MVAALAACSTGAVPTEFSKEHARVQEATVPPGVTLTQVQSLARDKDTLRAQWTMPAKQPWDDYVAWATPRMQAAGYSIVRNDERTSAYSKHLPGDVVSVVLELRNEDRITATFLALPD